jgi:hypothetical protein
MAALHEHPTPVTFTRQSRWLGEPASEVTGSLADVVPLIPAFDRFPFGTNARLDMIVRHATAKGEIPVPTGVVSKRYVLVQHASVIAALEKALHSADVEPLDLRCGLTLSESGARMRMTDSRRRSRGSPHDATRSPSGWPGAARSRNSSRSWDSTVTHTTGVLGAAEHREPRTSQYSLNGSRCWS